MADATLIAAGSNTANTGTTRTTPAFNPPAVGAAMGVFVTTSLNAGAGVEVSSITDSSGDTWVLRYATGTVNAGTNRRITFWTCESASSTASRTLTFNYPVAPNSVIWSILRLIDLDFSDLLAQTPNEFGSTTGSTSWSDTWATAPDSANLVLAATVTFIIAAITPHADFTELSDTTVGSPDGTLEVQKDTSPGSNLGASWTGSSGYNTLAVELRAAGGGGPDPVTGAGALVATAATLAATAVLSLTGVGALAPPAATLSGSGALSLTGDGALTASPATLSGSADLELTGGGALAAPPATLSGSAALELTGDGALTAPAATLSGIGTIVSGVAGAGNLTAPPAVLSGSAALELTGDGALVPAAATLVGSAVLKLTGDGVLVAPASTLTGTGTAGVVGVGALVPPAATLSGSAALGLTGDGVLVAVPAVLSGTGDVGDVSGILADALYLGVTPVDRVYLGTDLVW